MKQKLNKLKTFTEVNNLNRDNVKKYLTKYKIDYTSKTNTVTLKNKLLKYLKIDKPKKSIKKSEKNVNKSKKNNINLKQLGDDIIIILPNKEKKIKTFTNPKIKREVINLVKDYNKKNNKKTLNNILTFFNEKKVSFSEKSLNELLKDIKDPQLSKAIKNKLKEKTESIPKPETKVKTQSKRRGEY